MKDKPQQWRKTNKKLSGTLLRIPQLTSDRVRLFYNLLLSYKDVIAYSTRKDAYPLPRIDATLNTLHGSRWFSTYDLLSGYWQVEVAETDRRKTAFCTTESLYQICVMPFGLCNAPATFQQLTDLVLAGLKWRECLVYLDDVIVLGRTFQEHFCKQPNPFGHALKNCW